ncbi:hypothetical protein STHAL_19995 [Streptomyces halstedii]|uniref:Integral membrane protein n=1 Tax=Streptomyces halstedii TaxID=1944 RepID=A0ABS6TTX2_STRHA|nr:DUF6010 family protein [Streptomyces halstedii]MBV7671732.1 hypothetical protein [Streptomyces halstedii]
MTLVSPLIVGIVYCSLMSLVKEPHRRHFNAIMVGGAGAAYLSGGGFGLWELPFVALMAYVAYRGLDSWTFIGIGWLLHTAWDVAHWLKGNPILPFAHNSSMGCALCDPVIALWCLCGGPSPTALVRRRRKPGRTTDPVHDHASVPS